MKEPSFKRKPQFSAGTSIKDKVNSLHKDSNLIFEEYLQIFNFNRTLLIVYFLLRVKKDINFVKRPEGAYKHKEFSDGEIVIYIKYINKMT